MSFSKISQAFTVTVLCALPLLAQDGGEQLPPPPGLFGGNFLFIMLAMIAIIYFIMIRPEQKRQKERQSMLSALKKGDKILTVGGIVGVITSVKDNTYVIKSGEGAVLEVTKSAIQNVMGDPKAAGETVKNSKEIVKDMKDADKDEPDGKESR
ncbi:MAG: preprotein translocase subunit YajC [Chitinispirillales bacterium]|jgi:preprotein translocase subunit YajC|nr:preprotein translocase subunit YajC [Chitinispirillales bacterium]